MAAPYTLSDFARDTRAALQRQAEPGASLDEVARHLGSLLANRTFLSEEFGLPGPDDGTGERASTYLLYEDPELRFIVCAFIKPPHYSTSVHDHGDVWTVYGVYEGAETINSYVGFGTEAGMRLGDRQTAGAGSVQVVRPGEVHSEENGPGRAIALIVRQKRMDDVVQHRYDPAAGTRRRQVPPRVVAAERRG